MTGSGALGVVSFSSCVMIVSVRSHGRAVADDAADRVRRDAEHAADLGREHALTNHWSLKAEYLPIDLGSKTSRFVGNIFNSSGVSQGAWGQDGFNSKVNLDTAKAGINYKF